MHKTFTTWTYGNVRFLAIPHGPDVHVTDEQGNWYGGWRSIDSFRSHQKKGLATPLTGVFVGLSAVTRQEHAA